MIMDAGKRHISHPKTGNGLYEWNHGRTEDHKGVTPLVFCAVWSKLGIGILAFLQQEGMLSPESAHTVDIAQAQQPAVGWKRMLGEQRIQFPLWVGAWICVILKDDEIR